LCDLLATVLKGLNRREGGKEMEREKERARGKEVREEAHE
jgi:hypothetical protein